MVVFGHILDLALRPHIETSHKAKCSVHREVCCAQCQSYVLSCLHDCSLCQDLKLALMVCVPTDMLLSVWEAALTLQKLPWQL